MWNTEFVLPDQWNWVEPCVGLVGVSWEGEGSPVERREVEHRGEHGSYINRVV